MQGAPRLSEMLTLISYRVCHQIAITYVKGPLFPEAVQETYILYRKAQSSGPLQS